MRQLLSAIILTAALAGSASAYSGVVSADNVSVAPGGTVAVPIMLSGSDTAFSGYEIPIRFNTSALTVDSISFVGALGSGFIREGLVEPDSQRIRIILYPDFSAGSVQSIPASSGLLARIFFKASPFASPQMIPVDSINQTISLGNGVSLLRQVLFSDGKGKLLKDADFVAGSVTIQSPTDVDDDGSILPVNFEVAQNYPNPFNPTTSLRYSLPKAGEVRVEVFNVLGQSMNVLQDGRREAGNHTLTFDASAYPSGVYFYRVDFDGKSETRKMLLLK